MRRLIAALTDTIAPRLYKNIGGILIGLTTLPLRALADARFVLLRLSGRVPARVRVVVIDHRLHVGVPGAAPGLEHYRSSMWRPRYRR